MNLSLLLSLHKIFFLFFFFSFNYLSALEFTQEEKEWIKANPSIKVGVDNAWQPFDFINKEGKHDGMSADYLTLISQMTGLHFVVEKHAQWSEVLDVAKHKQLDMIAAIAPTDERLKYLDFTNSYMKYTFVLVTADKNSFFYEISDFNSKRIGVIKSYITEDILRQGYPEIEVVSYDDLNALLEGMVSGEIDAIFDNAVSMAHYIKKQGYSHLKMVTLGEQKRQISMAVTKGNEMLLSILNKALNAISTAEKLMIRNKWISFEYEKTIDYALLYKIIGLFLFFSLAMLYWYRKLSAEVYKRKESESQMSMLMDTIPLNVIVSGYDGSVLRANAYALETFSIAAEDVFTYNVMQFYSNPLEREDIMKTIKEEGKVKNRIVKFQHLDMNEMDIMISIIPIVYDGKKALLTIAVDLTKRIAMEEDLRQAKTLADAANKSKSDFLANMSHEIRTPMNAIIGFTELLNEEVKEARLKGYIKTIKGAGHTLLTLINDILDLSKIEAGKLEIYKRATNVFDLSEEVLSIFMIAVREKDVDLILDIDDNIPKSLLLDDIRLRQILVNLIGNAVKFTEEGFIKLKMCAVNVDDHLSKLDLEIVIEDTGIGISTSQRESIFQSFEQKVGQDNRKYGGTGLGLSISKRLIEMMGGKVSLESIEGEGSKFFLHLFNIDIASIQSFNESKKEEHFSAKNIVFKPAKLLIVDDIENNRELIVQNFEHTALTIITANDGYGAIEQYKKEQPDIILMDIRMPNMDGHEATAMIRKLGATVPIVALTASIMKDEYERIKSKDFDGYLRKPVLRDELFLELSHFLAYDTIEIMDASNESDNLIEFNENTLLHSALVLKEMQETLSPLHRKVRQNNNIEEIKIFISKVCALGEKYDVDILVEYASRLDEATEAFDIIQIQSLLREYMKIQEALELL